MTRAIRSNPAVRKSFLMDVAVKVALKKGYQKIDMRTVARHAKVSYGLLPYYFSTISNLKKEILQVAIEKELTPILLEALIAREITINTLPKDLQNKIRPYVLPQLLHPN